MQTGIFLESCALFLQYAAMLTLRGNTFDGNFGLSSGDSYFGAALMLHRLLSPADVIYFIFF
jgi:hypothetical protein